MNDQTNIDTGTALVVADPTDLQAYFRKDTSMNDMLDKIEAAARAETHDLETKKGRDAIASLAYRIARTKTALDNTGKAMNEDRRAAIDAVDAERRRVRERLDALKAEIRAPLDKWEEQEEARHNRLKNALRIFDTDRIDATASPDAIREVLSEIETTETGPDWQEYQPIAEKARADALAKYGADLRAAEVRAAELAELEQLRAAAQERARRDAEEQARKEAEEAEARRRAEAQEEAKRQAEAEAERERRAAEDRERHEREKREAAELATREAAARAEADRKAAEERHANELTEAKAREDRAAQAERDRIAAERRAEEEARQKREKDRAHRARIRDEIAEGLTPYMTANPKALATAILDGKIPHVRGIL